LATPAANVRSYAVRERLPPCLKPASISHGGIYLAADRSVRWGPFQDHQPRTLSYTLKGAGGEAELDGYGSFDGCLPVPLPMRSGTGAINFRA
jgi:hypothetical protein